MQVIYVTTRNSEKQEGGRKIARREVGGSEPNIA